MGEFMPGNPIPAHYLICVEGSVDTGWARRMSGMDVAVEAVPGLGRRTVLVGPLPSPTELDPILDALHRKRLPVISVRWLGDDPAFEGE